MSYAITFHIEAWQEYKQASLWYEAQSEGLGLKFETAVENKLSLICKAPYAYPIKKKSFRQTTIEKFPFLIVYEIIRSRKTIQISAIFHMSRNPGKKYRSQ